MRELYSQLLKDTGFEIIKVDNQTVLDFAKNTDMNLYYVVAYFNDFSNFTENIEAVQKQAYEYISTLDEENIIKRNSYLIMFVQSENTKELSNGILELQESTLFFKKIVITHTKTEKESMIDVCSNSSINQLINNETYNVSNFEKYKERNNNDYYSLLLKLIIKTPHISLRNQEKRDYPFLEDKIKQALIAVSKEMEKDFIQKNSQLKEITLEDYTNNIELLWKEIL